MILASGRFFGGGLVASRDGVTEPLLGLALQAPPSRDGRTKVEQVDRTGAGFVCTPCVNCFDGLDNLARDVERPWRPVHLWTLLARAITL